MSTGRYTFLPELYDIFGREATIKFLEVFSGCSIKVPKVEKLQELAYAIEIYVRLESARTEAQKERIIDEICEKYDTTSATVIRIYSKTKVKLEEELNFTAVRRRA